VTAPLWELWRQDDNGNRVRISAHASETEAGAALARFESLGHKQTYWLETRPAPNVLSGTWASGEAYDAYVGRWSRLVAREFLTWLAMPRGGRWLDVGCGTGALSETVVVDAEPAHVYAVDRSAAFVATARGRLPTARASCVVADAQSVPLRDLSVDAVISGLVLNFVPRPEVAIGEMARVLRGDGGAAVYVWDYSGEMQLMRYFWAAAVALSSDAAAFDEGWRFSICNPDALESLFRSAGFREVESRAIDVPTRFRDFDDYWTPFLGGQGPGPGYVTRLSETDRAALRERLRATLPTTADGSIPLIARAWAVRGTK
jgi:SAM-dependent methyltransferase